CKDLTNQIAPITAHWKKEGIDFDVIYTGYLASKGQIQEISKLFHDLSRKGTLIFVDPAMADNGKLYTGFDNDFPRHMSELCKLADVIVPNITEACLLTDTPYQTVSDWDFVMELLGKLEAFGCGHVAITGVSIDEKTMGIVSKNRETGEISSYFPPRLPHHYHGTGDLFASATVGSLARGLSLQQAMSLAADFVAQAITATANSNAPRWYGVSFEPALPYLIEEIGKKASE
ncbi:MAG: PfkB family carbohydrate kinase, partial [Eubacteriales bacterium]